MTDINHTLGGLYRLKTYCVILTHPDITSALAHSYLKTGDIIMVVGKPIGENKKSPSGVIYNFLKILYKDLVGYVFWDVNNETQGPIYFLEAL